MKKLMNFPAFLIVAFLGFTIVSCTEDDNTTIDNGTNLQNSAYDLTVSNPDFSSLRAALEATGLAGDLDRAGTYTVFAPTNAAFQDFLDDNNFASLNDVPVLLLRNVLRNHVLGTVNRSTDLVNGYTKTSATNADGDFLDLYVDLTSGVVLNGGAEVTAADNDVANGVVHIVDEVIGLPSVATLAAANPSFSSLVTALSQESLVSVVDDATATFTVFAPLNDSFQALIDADPNDGITSIQDILALSNLSDILLYHVVSGAAVRAEDITNGQVVDPVTAGTFTIDTSNGVVITDGSGTNTNVIVTNVTGINGVVHAIDFVLRPM